MLLRVVYRLNIHLFNNKCLNLFSLINALQYEIYYTSYCYLHSLVSESTAANEGAKNITWKNKKNIITILFFQTILHNFIYKLQNSYNVINHITLGHTTYSDQILQTTKLELGRVWQLCCNPMLVTIGIRCIRTLKHCNFL